MNVIFTYCSFNQGKEIDTFFFKMCLLAIGTAKKNIEDAHIKVYCDKYARRVFDKIKYIDELIEIDYSKYDFDHRFWCFPKFISYSLQNEPFVHIDLDMAIIKKVSFDNSDIISERKRPFDKEPEELKYAAKGLPIPDEIFCSGIFGGSNTAFFKDFFRHASELCSTKNLANDDVLYEHLYSLEEVYSTQKIENSKMSVKVMDDSSYLHFWERPKNQYYDTIDELLLRYDLL